MARRLSAEWRAEWRERLVRFRGWTGNSGDFYRQEGISRSSLLRWANRLLVPARSRPGTNAALRVVLSNSSRLELLERAPPVLRLVVE